MDEKQQFYNDFLAEMEKAMESTGIHVVGTDLKANKGLQVINFYVNDNMITPSIPPELYLDMCENGIPMEDIINILKDSLLDKIEEVSMFDIHNVDPADVAEKLCAAVVNYGSGKDWLQNMPHEKILDLAVYAKIDFGAGYGLKVDDRILTDLHMTREELFKSAKENVLKDRELIKVEELAMDYNIEYGIKEGEVQDLMNLLSLKPYIYDYRKETELDGAALISSPGTLKQIHEQLDGDFYILPCSVEQVLIVLKSTCEMELEDLEKFVKDMCDREVPLQNQLSSQVYEFDGTALKLTGDNLTVEKDNLSNAITHHRSR